MKTLINLINGRIGIFFCVHICVFSDPKWYESYPCVVKYQVVRFNDCFLGLTCKCELLQSCLAIEILWYKYEALPNR